MSIYPTLTRGTPRYNRLDSIARVAEANGALIKPLCIPIAYVI